MKIALLTAKPNRKRNQSVREKRPPHGIGFLYSILRNEDDLHTDIFDYYSGEKKWPLDDFESYDIVGIYCATICTDDISNIISTLRSKKIIVGGPHAHIYPEWFPEKVSHIVRGETEHIIVDLIRNPNKFPRIVSTPRLSSKELDGIPRFPFEYFYHKSRRRNYVWNFEFNNIKPIFTMNTSRGCPFNCSFCCVKKIWRRKFTFMSPERIFDDIEYVKSFGAKGMYFREDNFTINKRRVIELCENLIRHGMNLKWACETRVDTADDEMMKLMARAGCIGFYVGVEHLSQRMLDVFNKEVTVDQILRFFDSAHKYNMRTAASLIVNHPSETRADMDERERLLKVIKPTIQWRNTYRDDV